MKKIFSVGALMVIVALASLSAIPQVMASPFSYVDYYFDAGEVTGQGQQGWSTSLNYGIDPNGVYLKIYASAISILWVWTKSWIQVDVWSGEFVFTDPSHYCNVEWYYEISGLLLANWELNGFSNARIETWVELYDITAGVRTTWRDVDITASGPDGWVYVGEPRVFTQTQYFIQGHRYKGILRARATAGPVQAYEGSAVSDFFTDVSGRRIKWNYFKVWTPTGSCPFLYACNGTTYQYIAETLGPGGLGFPDASLRYDTRPPDPRDYIVLDADQLPAVNGKYILELAEHRGEISYIDKIALIAVDHPPGYDIYSPSVYTQIPLPFEYHTASNPITPLSAIKYDYQWGYVVNVTNVLEAVTYLDDFNYTVSDPNQFHTIELDFGDLGNLDDIQEFKLIIGGWLVIDHESIPDQIEYMKQHPELVRAPYIEVINETGMWEAVGEPICGESFWGPNTVTGTSILMRDIRHWLKTSDYRLRLNYWGGYMMDWIAVDITDTPYEETIFTVKKPIKADLWYKGGVEFLPVEGDTLGYYSKLPDWYTPYTYDTEQFIGYFTRYGNVKPLLKDSDDMFVITNYGDSIHLEFEEVPIPEGMERHYYLYIDGFYKQPFVKHLLNSTINTVDPLPFHAMTTYPYPENESYPDDPIHQAYLNNWNTRYIGP